MFKRLLLPVDGSALSLRAAEAGIRLAAGIGAQVHAFSVVAPVPTLGVLVDALQANGEPSVDAAGGRAEAVLRDVAERARAAGVACECTHVVDIRPYAAIVAAAVNLRCDLIVMASHGWTGMDRLLLGSQTQKVLASCDVPVLVWR